MMYDWRYDNGGHDWFGFGLMLMWWMLVFLAVVFLVRYLRSTGTHQHGPREREESASDILKKRYARGEIDKREYEEKRKDIES